MSELLINAVKTDDTTVFKFAPNPKRPHSKVFGRYEAYSKATNIEEYRAMSEAHDGNLKNVMPSLRYDEAHGYLTLFDKEGVWLNEPAE